MLQLANGDILGSIKVESDPSTVQATGAILKIYGFTSTVVPANGNIYITVPTDVDLKTGNLNCSFVLPVSNFPISQCVGNGKQIIITITKNLPADNFEIHIDNVLSNPQSTTPTQSFTFETRYQNGTQIDYQNTNINLQATVGDLTSPSFISTSKVVGASSKLEIRFTPTHYVPPGGFIQVIFPKWNPQAPTSQQQEYLSGGFICETIAVLQSSVQCTFSNSVLVVSGAFGSKIGNTEVGFRISGFKNPLSTATISGFSILTQDQIGGNIDISNSGTLSVTDAATLTSASIQVDSSVNSNIAGIVQESNTMKLTFQSPVPLDRNCQIKVTLPTSFSISTINSVQVSGLFGSLQTATIQKNSVDNSFSFTQCSSYTQNTMTASILINSLIMPNYNKETSSFQVAINTSSGNKVANVLSGVTFTASPGTLSAPAILPLNSVLLSKTSINIQFQTVHGLDLTTRLSVTFPSTYVMGSTCSITAQSSQINQSASCTVNGQTLIINSLLNTIIGKGQGTQLQFSLQQVTLPLTTSSKDQFQLVLYEQDQTNQQFYTVDQFSGSVPITLQSGSLNAVVTPASQNAFDTTTYKFEITPDHYVPQNGYIQIIYPSEISITDPSYSQSQCKGFINFPTTPTCVISGNTITINNGFRLSAQQPFQQKYTLSIPGIRNPVGLTPTSTFKFYTYTQAGGIIDLKETGITVQMTQTANMKSVVVAMNSYTNAALSKYTFSITATVPVTENNQLIIQFPAETQIPSQSQLSCSSDDIAIFDKITCNIYSLLSNSIQVQLDLKSNIAQINVLQTFRISVSNVRNPISTKPTSQFNINITDISQSVINRSPNNIIVSTNTPYTMQKSSIKANTTGAQQPALYTITIYPEHDINIGGGIYISYPTQVTPTKISAKVLSIYTKSDPTVTIDLSARQILIRNAFQLKVTGTNNDQVFIELEGFINPSYSQQKASSFVVKTFNQETLNSNTVYYYIDQITNGLILNSACDYPCATCDSTTPSICTSCFTTNTDLNKLQGDSCVSECSSGKYFDSKTGKCSNCTYPCLACNNSATNCTVCGYQDFLYLYNNTCKNDCPSGYVTDSTKNLCQKCSSECKTCSLTPKTCTSCVANSTLPYFYQSQCLKTCPANVTLPNIASGTCQSCDTNCKTCSVKTTNCTSCESFMKFDKVQNTCTSVCQQGTQIYDDSKGQCFYCDSNCNTCSGTVNTCTSCPSSQILNTDNVCRTGCNSLDQIPINNVCKQCELPCSQCKNTLNHCTKCQGDYLLYNTTCVQYCPEKFEPKNDTRQCILIGLICPTGFTINEAGDGCIPNEFECPKGQIVNKQKTACVPAPGSPVPFPFLFFSVMLGLLVLGSFIKDRFFTKIYTNLIALISLQEMLMYILLLAYAGAREVWPAFGLAFVAILTLMTSNIMFYFLYKRDILKDEVFTKWQRSFPKTSKYVPLISLFLNFKAIRLFYSGFYGLESCLAQFEDPMKNFFKPLKMITYFNYIFVYLPILVADIIIFTEEQWGYQLLILAIETFIITILMSVLTYLELRHPEKLVFSGDEQYKSIKPRSFANDTMVMAGMIDVDESTLIRSKVVDDDYEVFLRKKAFVSILNQVGKNYFNAQEKGLDLGGKIDQVMTKFDKSQLKLRRAFSLEIIKEEESWYIISDGENKQEQTRQPPQQEEDSDDEYDRQRRFSYPLTPRSRATAPDPMFKKTLHEIKTATKEVLVNNVYAECKAPDKNQEKNRRKTVSRRTQTYLRELLHMEGEDLQDIDLEIVLEDDAEIEADYAQGLIDGVIDGISESESNVGGVGGKRRAKKKRKNLNTKRTREIPDFELADIMGDFEIDDLGNFIILRGEKGELLDKKERRVNRRGYLVDRFGNIINKLGQIIFKAVELDSDDEIPAPFGFEKRKKNLLNLGQDGEFKVEGQEKNIDDDEDLIDKELRMMKKSKKKRRQLPDGQIVEEEGDNEEGESSVDSLMAESPGKYQLDQYGFNEDEIIANVTKKKVPVKRLNQKNAGKRISPQRQDEFSPTESSRKKTGPLQNLPPKRIKREDTKEMFPSLAIEASEQKKLFKIAEQIGGMANQIADNQRKQMQTSINSNLTQHQNNQEIIEKLKQEHFKDLMNQQNQQKQTINASEKMLPPKPKIEKIYGNLNDVVSYEEQILKEQYKNIGPAGVRAQSPLSSQMTTRMGFRPESSVIGGDRRKLRGLESIYLQKFDKKAGLAGARKQNKAKFRNTLQQFVDDPELLLEDGVDRQRQNDMSLMVADKLERLQRQYITSTTTHHNFQNAASSTSIGFKPTVGQAVIRKNGSLSGSLFHQDPSLEPIKKGNWINKD